MANPFPRPRARFPPRPSRVTVSLEEHKRYLLAAIAENHLGVAAAVLDAHPELLRGGLPLDEPLLAGVSADGHVGGVRILLDRGADVNGCAGPADFTALLAAAEAGHQEIMNLLLDRGADGSVRGGPAGLPALLTAVEAGHLEVVQLLLDRGARVTDAADAKALLEIDSPPGPAVNQATVYHDGWRPLILTYDGFRVNDKVPEVVTEGGWNALMRASYGNRAPMVAALLTRGAAAGVLSRGSRGRTAADLTADPLIKAMLGFAAGAAQELPTDAIELLVAQAAEKRRCEAAALLWKTGQLGAELTRPEKDSMLTLMIRDWMLTLMIRDWMRIGARG